MDLEKLELESLRRQLNDDGYVILQKFIDENEITNLLSQAKRVFEIQFDYFGYSADFKTNMIRLFNEHESVFINCGKLIQTGLIELYQLAIQEKNLNLLKKLGLQFPNMCTRPVLFFNHPKLAKEEIYYKTPKHQDWSSMLASMNSLVVWIPLIDVNENNGSIIVYPKSHKSGILPFNSNGGFAEVQYEGDYIQPKLKVGDIVIFSTLLVHKSGDILDDSIRWSCHFRYTDMAETNFIERGYPSPYTYKSILK